MDAHTDGGIRARAREVVRDQLAETALELFEERGFEGTTVEDVAAAAGISSRTFYRYFGTKEDVLLGDLPGTAEAMRELLAERIPEDPPWTALHHAVRAAAAQVDPQAERWARLICVVNASDALRARNLERYVHLSQALVPILAPHVGHEPAESRLRASVLVQAALMCFDIAVSFWAEEGEGDLLTALDVAFDSFPSGDGAFQGTGGRRGEVRA